MVTKPQNVKNILLVTSSNFPFGGAGANVLRLLTTGLVKTNRNISVLLQRGKQFGKKSNSDLRTGQIGGVSYTYCGYLLRPSSYLKKFIDTLAGIFIPPVIVAIKKLKNKIDCVLVYNGSAYESVALLVICKILRIPIINYVVEWYEKGTVATCWWKLPKWWDFLFRMEVMNKYFDGLIVTGQFLKKYYTDKNIKGENILIQPNLVDISKFENNGKPVPKRENTVRIGYCGTPTRKDGINDLLLSFQIVQKNFANSELLVVGDSTGRSSLIPKLEETANELRIFEKVKFTGLVDHKQMPSLLNSCDILVLARPSGRFAEAGFPTKLGEYMACKKPIVATKAGDIPIYLKDKENAMLAEPDNPESIASKILYLIENPEIAKEIGENGYLWAKNILDYVKSTQVVRKFLDMFIE